MLQAERVGVTDNFFRIGGDSILSIRLVARMRQLGYQVVERDIFDCKNVRELLNKTSTTVLEEEKAYSPFSLVRPELLQELLAENNLVQDEIEDVYPVAYLQAGMLIESLFERKQDTYHDVLSFEINAGYNEASLTVFLRDIPQTLAVILNIWMYLTPIIYPISAIPEEWRNWVLWLNPMCAIAEVYRDLILKGEINHGLEWGITSAIALVVFSFGLWIYRRLRPAFADVL